MEKMLRNSARRSKSKAAGPKEVRSDLISVRV
jgi:hypothetical protein